jgi:carboxyl-terminal processing protease
LVPVGSGGSTPNARNARVTLGAGATVREAPDTQSDVLGRVEGGALQLDSEAELDGFVRVKLGESQVGWVARSELGEGSGGSIRYALNHMPPRIELDHGDTLVTREDSLRLRGTATDTGGVVRDLYVFAGAQKVFYTSSGAQRDRSQITFDTNVPLHGGINYITVFARESDEVVSRSLIVVRRDGPDGALLPTPRWDDEVFGSVPGGDAPAE